MSSSTKEGAVVEWSKILHSRDKINEARAIFKNFKRVQITQALNGDEDSKLPQCMSDTKLSSASDHDFKGFIPPHLAL